MPEYPAAQSQTTEIQRQNIFSSHLVPDPSHRTCSETNSFPIASTYPPSLGPAPPTTPASVLGNPTHTPATEPPAKRRRGRPRKNPLPAHPPQPSPNPTARFGRVELTQLVAASRHGIRTNDEEHAQRFQTQPNAVQGRAPAANETTMQTSPTAPLLPGTFAPYHFRPVPPSPLPPVSPALAGAHRFGQLPQASPGQMPPTMAAPSTTQASGHFFPGGPIQLPVPEPIPTATQPFLPSSAFSATQFPATARAPGVRQAPNRSDAIAAWAAAPSDHARFTADPGAGVGPNLYNNLQTNTPLPTAMQLQQPMPAIHPAFAGSEAHQSSFASIPPPEARQPREPEEVYRDPSPGEVQDAHDVIDLYQQPMAHGVRLRNPDDVAAAEERLVRDLAAVYQAHNPLMANVYPRGQYPHPAPYPPPLLSISPSVTWYPLTGDPATYDGIAVQQQYLPSGQPPFPLNAYLGRNLGAGPVLPFMTLTGGPAMPCFQRNTDGNRADVGFGPGIRIADAFTAVARRYESEHKLAAMDFHR